jgi:3D (Asp-Asp-Asp) domain-containing protein
MRNNRPNVRKRRASLIRKAVILTAVACVFHTAHRECATIPGKPLNNKEIGGRITALPEEFEATAYCLKGITKSGSKAAPGCVAADPEVIPLGSLIHVDSPLMGGIYQVLDTGGLIKGKIIDIFIPSYDECIEFGRRRVKVKVLRHGFAGSPIPGRPGEKAELRTADE